MIDQFMNNLSIAFVMDLYRIKSKTENRGDTKGIENLKQRYPELFTEEFQEFIDKTKLVVADLDKRYGENFSAIFELEYDKIKVDNLH